MRMKTNIKSVTEHSNTYTNVTLHQNKKQTNKYNIIHKHEKKINNYKTILLESNTNIF